MHSVVKASILSFAALATTLAAMPQADAGDRWRHQRYHHHRGGDAGDLLAAGAIGLAVGALIGAATQPPSYREPVYAAPRYPRHHRTYRAYDPEVVYYEEQRGRAYYGAAEPWTAEWYDYCNARYRSFNARTGTYRGYDGLNHFCVAR